MGIWPPRFVAIAMLPASLAVMALDRFAHELPPVRRVRDIRAVAALLRAPLAIAADDELTDADDADDPALDPPEVTGPADLDEDPVYVGSDGQLVTVQRIQAYLEQYDSPLVPYAAEIVREGRRWDVDPRLVVAISGTESTFGRYHHGHNAWGWDAPNGLTRWPSWRVGVARYIHLFARHYRSRDPRLIGPHYAPLDPAWAETTLFFFSQI